MGEVEKEGWWFGEFLGSEKENESEAHLSTLLSFDSAHFFLLLFRAALLLSLPPRARSLSLSPFFQTIAPPTKTTMRKSGPPPAGQRSIASFFGARPAATAETKVRD